MRVSSAVAMSVFLSFGVLAAQPQYVKPPGAVAPATYLVSPRGTIVPYPTSFYSPFYDSGMSYLYSSGMSDTQPFNSGYLTVPNYPMQPYYGYPIYTGATYSYSYAPTLYPTWNGRGYYTPYVGPLLYQGP